MTTWPSVITSCNGYLMFPVVRVLPRCHVVVAESPWVVCCGHSASWEVRVVCADFTGCHSAENISDFFFFFFSSIYVFDFPGMLCYALFCQDMNYHIWVSGLYVQVRTIQNFEVINFVRSELQGQNQNPIICMHKVIYDFTGLEESYKSEVEKTKSSDLSIKLIHHLKVHSVVLRSCYIYLYLPPPF